MAKNSIIVYPGLRTPVQFAVEKKKTQEIFQAISKFFVIKKMLIIQFPYMKIV